MDTALKPVQPKALRLQLDMKQGLMNVAKAETTVGIDIRLNPKYQTQWQFGRQTSNRGRSNDYLGREYITSEW